MLRARCGTPPCAHPGTATIEAAAHAGGDRWRAVRERCERAAGACAERGLRWSCCATPAGGFRGAANSVGRSRAGVCWVVRQCCHGASIRRCQRRAHTCGRDGLCCDASDSSSGPGCECRCCVTRCVVPPGHVCRRLHRYAWPRQLERAFAGGAPVAATGGVQHQLLVREHQHCGGVVRGVRGLYGAALRVEAVCVRSS